MEGKKMIAVVALTIVVITVGIRLTHSQQEKSTIRSLKKNLSFPFDKILKEPIIQRNRHAQLYLLILVSSNPHKSEHVLQRNAIRETWGNCSRLHSFFSESSQIPKTVRCRLVFFVGRSTNDDKMIAESEKYNDIFIADYRDSYDTITHKQMLVFKWAMNFNPKFVLKTDDDIFVHVQRLILKLRALILSDFYGGVLLKGNVVNRDKLHRHYITKEQFADFYYPTYCKGAMYVFSGHLLPRLIEAADFIPYMHVDDAYVGILMHYISVDAQPIDTFIHFREHLQAFKFCLSDCMLMKTIAISDGFTSHMIRLIHERIKILDKGRAFCIHGIVAEIVLVIVVLSFLRLLCSNKTLFS